MENIFTRADFQNWILYKKKAYGKYISYATPRGYVACLGAQVFKFPWRVIFVGFLADGEQKPKLGGQIQPTPGAQINFFLHSKNVIKSVKVY